MDDGKSKGNDDLMYIQGRCLGICTIILICAFVLASLTLIFLVWLDSVYLDIGLLFLALTLLMVIPFLFVPCWILFSEGTVKELSFFRRVRKEKDLADLKEVVILTVSAGRGVSLDYYCLAFNEYMTLNNYSWAKDLAEEENLVLFHYSKRSTKLLEKYVNVPVRDIRK